VYRYLDEEEGRVEVILEGSDRIDSTWKEYNFRFKPGDTSDRLPIACTYIHCFSDGRVKEIVGKSYKVAHACDT